MRLRALRPARLVALAWLLFSPPAGAAPLRIALLPVVVHSNEPETAYLSEGLAEMLSTRLERYSEISVVRLGEGATTDAQQAREAGRAAGADYVVFGSFTRFGSGASLDLRCAETAPGTDAGRQIFVQSGTLAEIIPKLDPLAARLKLYVSGSRESLAPAPEAGGTPAADDVLGELIRRVDALERAVYAPPGPPEDSAE